MSGSLAPSKSTVYISNLPFSITNNDLHQILEKFGKVAKVTIVKDKETRKSKGIAFVLFLVRDDAHKCVSALNKKELFGRTLKCSIAKDNGRAAEFIRRRQYPDKSFCYECGEPGHMSYQCPHNYLGDREPPKKKEKKRKAQKDPSGKKVDQEGDEEEEEEEENEDEEDSLSAAIRYEQKKAEEEEYRARVAVGDYPSKSDSRGTKRKRFHKDAYFSDEEELSD